MLVLPFYIRIPPAVPVVQKGFSYAQSRRSGLPPSEEGGGFAVGEAGGRETRREILSPSLLLCKSQPPRQRGPRRVCFNRICGGGAEYASERKFDEPIGSANKKP